LTALRQAVDLGWRTDWRYFFYVDPNLDSIREEPEFQAILSEVKKDMAAQLERARAMEANDELVEIPEGRKYLYHNKNPQVLEAFRCLAPHRRQIWAPGTCINLS